MHKIIVVADAKHAKFYSSVGLKVTELLKSIESEDFGIDHHIQELHTGYSKNHGSPSHFYDPTNDPKDLNRNDFSKVVVDALVDLQKNHKCAEIIIVTPAKMLGDIRELYPKHLSKIPVREITKDLTHSSEKEIEKIIFQK
jgi:protein required for attachment to host cells